MSKNEAKNCTDIISQFLEEYCEVHSVSETELGERFCIKTEPNEGLILVQHLDTEETLVGVQMFFGKYWVFGAEFENGGYPKTNKLIIDLENE